MSDVAQKELNMLSLKRLDPRLVGGTLLVVGGILFLLQNLGYFPGGSLFWGIAFGVGAVAFLWTFFTDRAQWWALIPGFALLGLTIVLLLSVVAPSLEDLGGALFLGLIGLGFWIVYLTNRQFWWAVIPGGVLVTLAIVAGMDSLLKEAPDALSGGVFFAGLGLTFVLLGFLPTPQGQLRWALIPGGILLVMGLLVALAAASLINYVWPIALIVAGLVLVWRTVRPR
jgi:hypothetical protein